MGELFHKIYVIEHGKEKAEEKSFPKAENIEAYIDQIVEENKKKHDHTYKFSSELNTMKTCVMKLSVQDDVNATCQDMADSLLVYENAANANIKKTGTVIPPSILIISLIEEANGNRNLYLIKADYEQFIAEGTGDQQNGLSMKRKIFKSCVFQMEAVDKVFPVKKIFSHDANNKSGAAYWLKKFLELVPVRNDEMNTQKSYKALVNVISPLKKKSFNQDYYSSLNIISSLYASGGHFSMQAVIDKFTNYHQLEKGWKLDDLLAKLTDLPNKKDFDAEFEKQPQAVDKWIKNEVELTDGLKLKIKKGYQELPNIIKSGVDEEGRKYMIIYSEEGFDFAKSIEANKIGNNENKH